MSEEPCISTQLNSILEYLNYNGHLFLRVTSDLGSDEIGEKENLFQPLET